MRSPYFLLLFIPCLGSTLWAKTLAPLGKIPKVKKTDDRIPEGHGWSFASAKKKFDDNK